MYTYTSHIFCSEHYFAHKQTKFCQQQQTRLGRPVLEHIHNTHFSLVLLEGLVSCPSCVLEKVGVNQE